MSCHCNKCDQFSNLWIQPLQSSCNHCNNNCNNNCNNKNHKHNGCNKRSSDHSCKKFRHKKCNKCFRHSCNCLEYFNCLHTRCGVIMASMTKSANPATYSAAGQVITYTYTITNTGTAYINYPIQICDDRLGRKIIECSNIAPGSSQSYTMTYTILPSDLLVPNITNIATAYIQVRSKKWVFISPTIANIALVV